MNRLKTHSAAVALVTLLCTFGSPKAMSTLPRTQNASPIAFNDNRVPAGVLTDGVLKIELEIVDGLWPLLGDEEPPARVLAFAERGKAPSIPGPLIRVPVGSDVHVTVTNPLDTAVVIHGFGDRRDGKLAALIVPAGTTQTIAFSADIPGTYFYWGATGDTPLSDRFFEDSQLSGALIVDAPGAVTDDRIMMIGMWFDGRLPDGEPDPAREFLVINGRPWPHTERLTYAMGDSIRWRLINTSADIHSMHLHGFFYRVDARGDLLRDTIYWPAQRRTAVTERIAPGTTMTLVWSPDRPGGWIFHCHMSIHVVPNPSMGLQRLNSEEREAMHFRQGHLHHDADHHVVEGMGGLLMAIYVQPPVGWAPSEPKRRQLRLFVQSRPAEGGLSGRHFGYVLQEGEAEPAPDSVRLPGSTLVLWKGEPTSIRVFNRTDEPTQVHWHGLEIESYFDGVAGVGGYPERLTPAIEPGESFEIRITPPRAGSFMYHTHINDLRQQGSGLYGAFIVLNEGQPWNPETDRVFLFGESPFRNDEVPVLNGANPPESIVLRVGTAYRLRFMNITLNRPNTIVRLLRDGFPVRWVPIAKDGFDLPSAQRSARFSEQRIAVGETYDFEYTPRNEGELRLEMRTGGGTLLVEQRIEVME